jgi:hypothetical protein
VKKLRYSYGVQNVLHLPEPDITEIYILSSTSYVHKTWSLAWVFTQIKIFENTVRGEYVHVRESMYNRRMDKVTWWWSWFALIVTERRGRVVNTPVSYLRRFGFKSRPGHRLSWLRIFMVFISPSRWIPELYLKVKLQPRPFKSFPIHPPLTLALYAT